MLVRSDVHVDRALTNYSLGYLDEGQYIADIAFPFVDVTKETDKYFIEDTSQARRVPETLRAMRTRSRQDNIKLSTASYACEEYALHDVLPDRLEAMADEVLRLREKMATNLLRKILLARELRVMTLLTTTTNYPTTPDHTLVGGADWGTPTINTKDEIDAARTLVLTATGAEPNLIIINWDTFVALQKNDDIRDRIKYTQAALNKDLTPQLLAQYWGVERVAVGNKTYETAKEGATSVKAQIWPDDVIVLRTDANPTRIDTDHFGVTFATQRAMTKRWREESIDGDVIQQSQILVEKIVNSSAGVHIDNVLA